MADWGSEWGELWGNEVAPVLDHEDQVVNRLPGRLRKPNIEAVTRNFGTRAQTIEDTIVNIPQLYDIDVASKIYQDKVGIILNQPRHAFTDAQYRVLQRVRAQIIKRRRTVEDLLTMVRRLLNDDSRDIKFTPTYPKAYKLEIEDLTVAEINAFIPFLKLSKPATYIGKFIVKSESAFGMSDATATIATVNEGFGDASGTLPDIGGPLAYIVSF